MSEPIKVFQPTRQHVKTGNLSFLTKQIAEWQKITKLIQPLLPQPEQWQVACYQFGILTITGENQAMISQLGYLQKHYVQQLAQLDGLKDLQKIQVRLRTASKSPVKTSKATEALPAIAQDMLKNAASFVSDPKLNQAMLRLARNKT
ncbi:DUF721 domain-containing protein [Acinetobacter larvae]|uniref:DUF721 domain-containing protein n=1 Tax=Acinetobacter larvae TaxID=1789224 RepID=A0A1B2M3P3_9GAMM|nr:DUF721 domain-containing protein [Acinetobacter larvae]AOA59653.1 DUF721 domain-containing protein [Acinetobacter larvae]